MDSNTSKDVLSADSASRSGLLFSPNYFHGLLEKYGKTEPSGAVYLAAAIEYLVAEVVELAGNAARDRSTGEKVVVKPQDIEKAMRDDDELNSLLEGSLNGSSFEAALLSKKIDTSDISNGSDEEVVDKKNMYKKAVVGKMPSSGPEIYILAKQSEDQGEDIRIVGAFSTLEKLKAFLKKEGVSWSKMEKKAKEMSEVDNDTFGAPPTQQQLDLFLRNELFYCIEKELKDMDWYNPKLSVVRLDSK